MTDNFSCSDYGISRVNITEEEWMVQLRGPSHNNSITALAVCQLIISVVGTVWNAIVLVIILLKKKFQDPTYVLLMNLVVADLLVSMLVLPFNVNSAFNLEFSLGQSDYALCRSCQTIGVLLMTLILVSFFTLSVLSWDRLVYIKWPLTYQQYISIKYVLIFVFLIWILGITVAIPPLFGFGEIRFVNSLSACCPLSVGRGRFTNNANYFIFLIVVGLLAFIPSLIANTWLLFVACKHIKEDKYQTGKNSVRKDTRSQIQKEKVHLAQVFGVLFIIYALTWLPIVATAPIQAVLGGSQVPIAIYGMLYLCVVSQPAIHPIMETCLMGKARD